MATAVRASTSVPWAYRLVLTIIEPLFAFAGALLAFCDPASYLGSMTRHGTPFAVNTAFLYTELGGGWLYFAFVEAVVLRLFDDLRLWRLLSAGMLLSDAAYCHSTAQAVGGWGVWVVLAEWKVEDWLVLATTAPMVLVRILLVLGVGIKKGSSRKAD